MHRDTVGSVKHILDDSPIWCGLLKVKHIYLKGRSIKVNDGRNTSFGSDTWLKDKPLYTLFPDLYDMCIDKKTSLFITSWSAKVS